MRAEAVRRAQEQGRYADVPGMMIQMSVTKNRQMIYRDRLGNEKMVSLDSLHADERAGCSSKAMMALNQRWSG